MIANTVSERNIRFLLHELFQVKTLAESDYYGQYTPKLVDRVIDAASKLAKEKLRPILEDMDRKQPELVDGQVRVLPEVRALMKEYGRGGWIGSSFPEEHDGEQMPLILSSACRFIFAAANYSASVYPELTSGAAELILTFGTPELIKAFVPPMLEGRWQGTMALTEPQAGSSLSDITTTAFPTDQGYFSIRGQKTFISAGDHDGVDNIVHLMLAKIEGAPEGAKGISLFVVPKKRLDDQGNLISNDVKVAGVYHKLGYRGAPITELSIGESNDCRGFLVGRENRGLACMFQMMNEARLGVGLGATAIASAAYQAALAYTRERTQGRPVSQKLPGTPQVPIIEHADVRRMLLFQKSVVEGSLSLILQLCLYADRARLASGDEKKNYELLLDLLTPIAKSYPSEMGILSASQALQCFGGYGYCDDFPVEQYYRDIRIHPLHEGTTGMQGMDLLGRKMVMEGGRAGVLFLAEVEAAIGSARTLQALKPYADRLEAAMSTLETIVGHLFTVTAKQGPETLLADATLFLEYMGIIAIAWQWLIQAQAAQKALDTGCKPADSQFYMGKLFAFQYFFKYELPKTLGLGERLLDDVPVTLAMKPEYFS
ncbi:MAG: acyl-CoA dehydrogenase [Pseudomonadota bacterium]